MSDETEVKRTRKPRDPNAPKAERKPRPLAALIAVDLNGQPVLVKVTRDIFGAFDLLSAEQASGKYAVVTMTKLVID